MSETFNDFRSFPEPIRKELMALEMFVCDVYGKTICSASSDNTFIDEGIIDTEEAVRATNVLAAEIERLREEVIQLATLGDFSGLRPNSPVFKQTVAIKQSSAYQQQRDSSDVS